MFKKVLILAAVISGIIFIFSRQKPSGPVIGIANFGPHSSLQDAIDGFREEMKNIGHQDKIGFEILDTNFDASLIGQMLSKLKSSSPKVIVTLTTPVAQTAQNTIKNIPLVFSCITDPVSAGITGPGVSDKPDLSALLDFAKKIIPSVKTVGILYAAGDANDAALLQMMMKAGVENGIKVFPVSIDQTRDIPVRMQAFAGKVDFLYVGVGASIQPALPVIIAGANKMNLPIFNADSDAVKKHQVLGSFGVDYRKIGARTAYLVDRVIKGEKNVLREDPAQKDHRGFLSKAQMKKFGVKEPQNIPNLIIVE
jgi:putative ABC transport system substrate-binding protein